jgi:hypothetical protein
MSLEANEIQEEGLVANTTYLPPPAQWGNLRDQSSHPGQGPLALFHKGSCCGRGVDLDTSLTKRAEELFDDAVRLGTADAGVAAPSCSPYCAGFVAEFWCRVDAPLI